MKKLRITVAGKQYDVDVEILEDDDDKLLPSYYNPNTSQSNINQANTQQVQNSQVPNYTKSKQVVQPLNADINNIMSPINGIVLEVACKVGQVVAENELVVVIEAMKMKTNVSSPSAGTILSVNVNVGDRVDTGQILFTYK